jgi:hypothetical protein
MFRFTIRDLLWLMVVGGCLSAWLVDHRDSAIRREADRECLASLTKALTDEQAKARRVVIVGSRADASTQIKSGETIVVSMAKDGMSASYRPLRVD